MAEREQCSARGTVIQVVVVILAITALAHLTMRIRITHIIDSTRLLLAQFSKMKASEVVVEIARTYFIYILLSILLLLCVCYVARKVLSSRATLSNSFAGHYSSRFLKPVILFLFLFYLLNLLITFQSRWQYAQFYYDFNEGRIGSEFMGFKQYHFLNHAHETNRMLAQLASSAKSEEQRALAENVRNLVSKQDKNISAFRSYAANYNLMFKLVNICYYFFAFFLSIGLIMVFALKNCCLSSKTVQGQYGSIEQQEHEEQSQQSLLTCPEESTKRKCCNTFFTVLILIVLSALILASFILGDVFVQFKIGHPYHNNIEQEAVCSFHNHIGGFFINIDYQHQLSLAEQFRSLQKYVMRDAEKPVELMEKLSEYLGIYMNLCQILQPYYLAHKELQSRLSEVFYRHFFVFMFVYWKYYEVLRELKGS